MKTSNLGYFEAILSIILNLILFLIKLWAGVMTGSIAIIADAWHTLSDSFTSLILLFGIRLSSKPPDKGHPFGHGRAEVIFSIIIGTILAVVAFNFLSESIDRLKHHQQADFNKIAVIILIVSVIAKEAIAQFAFWASRKTKSQLLRADGWHHRSDALTSFLVLIAVLLGRFFWWIDGAMGIVMALLLFYASYDILKNSTNILLGQGPDQQTKQILDELTKSIAGQDLNIHHLHCHNYGQHKEVTFHISLPSEMRLSEAHKIADNIENEIRKQLKIEATIHIDPSDQDD